MYSIGLISPDMYDQLLQRQNWINVEKTRNLLNSIRTVLSTRPTALKEFVTVLSQVDYCKQVADKIQQGASEPDFLFMCGCVYVGGWV